MSDDEWRDLDDDTEWESMMTPFRECCALGLFLMLWVAFLGLVLVLVN